MRYHSKNECKNLLGEEVVFDAFGHPKVGIITFEDGKYWLPFCGKVNAETIKFKQKL